MFKKCLLSLCLCLAFVSAANANKSVLVGVLEEPDTHKPLERVIRVMFAKTSAGWTTLDTPESAAPYKFSEIEWIVAFDGRSLGKVKATDTPFDSTYKWTYPRDKHLKIINEEKAPKIRRKSNLFDGWINAPAYRPLIVVSTENYTDPERWKPFSPPETLKHKLFKEFSLVVGDAIRIQEEPEWKELPYEYKAEELVFSKSYKSSDGRLLISLGLDLQYMKASYPHPAEWFPNWFLIDSTGVSHLGSELALVDAGDYDGNGKSEVIFWHSGYNRGGYTLFADNFKSRINFYWSYH